MNYITEIKMFYDCVQLKQLSTGQIALWHALMYINNKCAWNTWFTAPNLTLELLTGLSRSAIAKNRNVLKQLGLIDFKGNGTKATSYMLKSTQDSEQDSEQDSTQDSIQDSTQSSGTLNKLNKTKLDIKKNIKKKSPKKKYGEYQHVNLTDEELEKLKNEYGEELTEQAILFLDEYIEMKGNYKYNNAYLVINHILT